MSDLGTEIRHYYESVVERVDLVPPPVTAKPGLGYSMRTGLALAVLVAVAVLVIFGLGPLLFPVEPDPVGPPITALEPTVPTTKPLPAALAPSVLVTSDGVEIGSLGEAGPVTSSGEMETLIGYVMRELTSNRDYWPPGTDPETALGLDPGGSPTGLTIELTIDRAAQEIVESVIGEWLDDPGVFIGVVVVDNETGRVIAAGPGSADDRNTFDPERLLPAASLAQVYTTVAALEAGFPLSSEWDASSPQTLTAPDWEEDWIVHNAGGGSNPPTPLDQALYRAINTVFAGVGVELGPDAIIDAAARLGVDLVGLEELPILANPPINGFVPLEAVAVGAGEMTTFDAAAMFATLSRDGILTRPAIIETITDATGRIIYQTAEAAGLTIDAGIVEEVRRPLAMVPTVGTGVRANIGLPQIGKTGTADNYLAAWYAGSTERYTVAVSVGRVGPDGDLVPLENVSINGQFYGRVFGGSVPAPIWAEIVSQLHDISR